MMSKLKWRKANAENEIRRRVQRRGIQTSHRQGALRLMGGIHRPVTGIRRKQLSILANLEY